MVVLGRWSHARIEPGVFFFLFISRRDPYTSNVRQEIFAGVYFCGLAIFCVLRELIFPIRTDWFCLELIFAIFRKYPCTQHWLYFRFYWVRAIEIHISSNRPVFSCFWVREASCDCHDRHDFVVLYFLCREFRLENIYSGDNFYGKSMSDNFYLRELNFVDRWRNRKNRKNKNPQKFLATRYFKRGRTSTFKNFKAWNS